MVVVLVQLWTNLLIAITIGSRVRFPHLGNKNLRDLHEKILTAHKIKDQEKLVFLYTVAADLEEDTNTKCYYLTYAHIYALEMGLSATKILSKRLRDYGRE